MCIDPIENIWSLWCSTSILNAKIYYLSGFFQGKNPIMLSVGLSICLPVPSR